MLASLSGFLPLVNLLIIVGLLVGGFLAIHTGYGRDTSEIQSRAIAAMNAQIAAQVAQIAALEKKVERLEQTLRTIQDLLTQRSLRVEINGDFVTLIDESAQRTTLTRKRPPEAGGDGGGNPTP